MQSKRKIKAISIGRAKKIPADGSAPTYYYSKPKLKWYDLRGHLMLLKAMHKFKQEERMEKRNWEMGEI